MPIVPIPQTWWELFWTLFRVATPVTFIGVMIWGLRIVRTMLRQIQSDRLERDTLLGELQRTAAELATKTDAITRRVEERDRVLQETMETNTTLTREAAAAAKDAYHEANDVNQKIARTTEHLETVATAVRNGAALPSSSAAVLDQINEHTAAIAKNTEKE